MHMIGIIGRGANGARELLPRPLPLPLRTPAHVEGAHVVSGPENGMPNLCRAQQDLEATLFMRAGYLILLSRPSHWSTRRRSVGRRGAVPTGVASSAVRAP